MTTITKIEITKEHKSLTPFVWNDVPQLAVITGINGVGKSQFLEGINNEINFKTHHDPRARNKLGPSIMNLTTDNGSQLLLQKIMFIPSNWQPSNFGGSSRSNVDGFRQTFVNWVYGSHNPNPVPQTYLNLRKIIEKKTGKNISELSQYNIIQSIPHDYLEDDNRVIMNAHLSGLFVSYISKQKDLGNKKLNSPLYEGATAKKIKEDVAEELGIPPWEKINHLLDENDFDYQVTFPEDDAVSFQCMFLDKKKGHKVEFSDLSSGEKMIVTLILWSYNEQMGQINDLLLMDEPDAHLHPSMSKLFYKIISETLVGEYGIQVILTTHNPSTVALLPENNLFIMEKNSDERIKKPDSKQAALSLLTDNLLLVTSSFKVVFVEDEDDRRFYETLFQELIAIDKVAPDPPLIFKSVSTSKDSEGCLKVREWVKKLNSENPKDSTLGELFYGLIDLDNGNNSGGNLFVLDRYSIENYILDPVLVFCHLFWFDNADAQSIATDNNIVRGDIGNITDWDKDKLQKIADRVLQLVEVNLPTETNTTDKVNISFISDHTLQYPKYLTSLRGKDLHKAPQYRLIVYKKSSYSRLVSFVTICS